MKTAIAMREDKMAIEYIDREKAKRLLHIEYAYAAEQLLDEVPAADVAPVVHARWIPFHSETAGEIQYCSNCKIGNAAKSDFCPHCGAIMDGGDNDEAD